MKAVILAGDLGTRIFEETHLKPMPMIEIGGMSVLWHIMKIYSHYGIKEFIVCCGYKGYVIKEYFANYSMHTSEINFNMSTNSMKVHQMKAEPWEVTLVDTSADTLAGWAPCTTKYLAPIQNRQTKFLAYGHLLRTQFACVSRRGAIPHSICA